MHDNSQNVHETFCHLRAQKSASNKLILTMKFHECRMTTKFFTQHIAKIENIANQLKNIDENIIIMAKIETLPTKYNAFIRGSVNAAEQTLSCLRKRLIRKKVSSVLTIVIISANKKQHQRGQPRNSDAREGKRLFATSVIKYCFVRRKTSLANDKIITILKEGF